MPIGAQPAWHDHSDEGDQMEVRSGDQFFRAREQCHGYDLMRVMVLDDVV